MGKIKGFETSLADVPASQWTKTGLPNAKSAKSIAVSGVEIAGFMMSKQAMRPGDRRQGVVLLF